MEKIIIKIKNLLDLSNNNPNQNEAFAAALKAQELMAKYKIKIEDLEDNKSQIMEKYFDGDELSGNKKWRVYLAQIISKNFRCKCYLSGKYIVFYGYDNDAEIALEVFKMLVNTGTRLSRKEYYTRKKNGYSTKGVMNAFLIGFCDGVKEVLDRQCTALMIITPKEVEKGFEELTVGWKKKPNKIKVNTNKEIENNGRIAGKNAMSSRQISNKNN